MIKAGIIGGAGYTGGELIRILLNHPKVKIEFAHSNSQAGKAIHSIHQDLLGDTDLKFTNSLSQDVDVLFLCLAHGDSRKFLEKNTINDSIKIIDLSHDFRHQATNTIETRQFIYGLPELNYSSIQQADNIANPGCFATALQLALLPLSKNGISINSYATGITGSTGAGQSLSSTSHFSWRSNNIQAYKSLNHQHIKEVKESLSVIHPNQKESQIHFIPWRGDFARGIFISQQIQTDLSIEELYNLYETFYSEHPFTIISKEPIHLKQVVNTNKCLIQIEQKDGITVIHSAIDNLLKGASGQAVQNMNILFGLEQNDGLQLKANLF